MVRPDRMYTVPAIPVWVAGRGVPNGRGHLSSGRAAVVRVSLTDRLVDDSEVDFSARELAPAQGCGTYQSLFPAWR